MSRRAEAIEYIREARDIHKKWAALLVNPEGAAPKELVEALNDPERRDAIIDRVGNAHHHVKWAKRYELVLNELEEG